jgi:hypothetical protein
MTVMISELGISYAREKFSSAGLVASIDQKGTSPSRVSGLTATGGKVRCTVIPTSGVLFNAVQSVFQLCIEVTRMYPGKARRGWWSVQHRFEFIGRRPVLRDLLEKLHK